MSSNASHAPLHSMPQAPELVRPGMSAEPIEAAEVAEAIEAAETVEAVEAVEDDDFVVVGRHSKSTAAAKREASRKSVKKATPKAAKGLSAHGLHSQEGLAELDARAEERAAGRKTRMGRGRKKVEAPKRVAVSDEVAIRFSHVTKTYHLYKRDRTRIIDLLLGTHKHAQKAKNANDDLSFEIHRGEAVAFIGRNGAGKSTCLKMITGVIEPTSGEIEVNGKVSALLELGAGFNPALTGRENLEMRSHVMGISKEDHDKLMPKVLEFSELGEYLDQPLRSYSSGMKSRLGFALAVCSHPEILIVDEALSVGDRTFAKKCIARIKEIMEDENVTVLFVTHSSSMAKKFCSRGIVLNQGRLEFDGDIKEAIAYYEERN